MSDDVTGKVEAQACGNHKMQVAWRLWEITLCRINNWGHAPFDPKQLQMLVCGAIGKSEQRAVERGFKTLRALDRISPDSSPLCVVVNDDLWRRGAGKGSWEDACSEPSHRQHRRHVWSATRGWVTSQREPQGKTVDVPLPVSEVPVWRLPSDPWSATG